MEHAEYIAFEHKHLEVGVAHPDQWQVGPLAVPLVKRAVAGSRGHINRTLYLDAGRTALVAHVDLGNIAVEQTILGIVKISGYAVTLVIGNIGHHLGTHTGHSGLGIAVVLAVAHQHYPTARGLGEPLGQQGALPGMMSEAYECTVYGGHSGGWYSGNRGYEG